ncbi:MAG: elongation factor P [Candidatus Omnitrophica bacterium]|nr:elongation factor P [Candidatus Omnitrophota bacterium]
MALSINEIKVGVTILVDKVVYAVIDTHHVKPGKGSAFVRAKVRNMKTGAVLEKTFRGDEKIEHAYVEERKLQYTYNSGDIYHFMDQETYEEVAVSADTFEDQIKFLKDNLEVSGYFYKGEALTIKLPFFVIYTVTHTEPGIKGDTAKSGTKPAEIESGANVQVPLFINVDDKIKVDTRTGQYVERASA